MDNILEEIISVLFQPETISKAEEQNQNFRERVPIDTPQISFRLFRAPAKNINLEIMMQDKYGMYFKPVGYYLFDNTGLKNIIVLKEFEEAHSNIKNTIDSKIANRVKYLSMEENGYIALASREVANTIKEMFHSSEYSPFNHLDASKFQVRNLLLNGLKVQVRTSMMGSLEANLNEDTDEDIFVMYQNNNGISVHCSEEPYNLMMQRSLLGAFK